MISTQVQTGASGFAPAGAGASMSGRAAGGATFDVRVPLNARPGVTIMARAPNGKKVRLTVPHGVHPGATITVRY